LEIKVLSSIFCLSEARSPIYARL